MRQIYFDNAATTPLDPAVISAMEEIHSGNYGNPSSIHSSGQRSKVKLEQSRTTIASYIGAQPGEIIFTSGGTESDNLAIIGTAMANRDKGRKIISTRIEHPAVLQSLYYLAERGFEIDYLSINRNGGVDLAQLEKMTDENTILVSVMLANNETGIILDLEPIIEIVKQKGILFHTDAIQALGRTKLDVQNPGIDLLSLSSHKIYGPQGIGVLYLRSGVKIKSQMVGGAQEINRRAGTENLPAIVGFASAIRELEAKKDEIKRTKKLRDLFEKLLIEKIPGVEINGGNTERLCTHSNVYFPFISGDGMLMNLDMNGIAVSTGSACSSGSAMPSHVLTALGYERKQVENSVRFSFGRFNTEEEVDIAVNAIYKLFKRAGKN